MTDVCATRCKSRFRKGTAIGLALGAAFIAYQWYWAQKFEVRLSKVAVGNDFLCSHLSELARLSTTGFSIQRSTSTDGSVLWVSFDNFMGIPETTIGLEKNMKVLYVSRFPN